MNINRYYDNHLRSLFISKFNYMSPSQIVNFSNYRFTVCSPLHHFDMAYLFFSLYTYCRAQKLPKVVGNYIKFSTTLPSCYILQSLTNFSLPVLDNSLSTHLVVRYRSSDNLIEFEFANNLEIFFELDFITNYNYSLIKSLSRQ